MRYIAFAMPLLFLAFPLAAQAPDFYGHWADGRAEISSYRIIQQRYGEAREGHAVLIFVTEDIHRDTYIKVESPTPKEDRLYTLKLNHVLKFNTGIYDYSVMTSVFSIIDGEAQPFTPKKVSLSAQEWCGHVFEEVRLEGKKLTGQLNSYFEKEGRQDYALEAAAPIESEDHLLIRIRELNGAFMQPGEKRSITVLPSLWYFRVMHQERSLVKATLHKGSATSHAVGDTTHAAIPWIWKTAAFEKTVWVEKAYPHRILAWQDSQGNSGELLKTMRAPYWGQHSNADRTKRQWLEIP